MVADLLLMRVSIPHLTAPLPAVRRWHRVATRSGLALLGVVSAVMATGAGYGIAMVMGQPFTTLTQVGRGATRERKDRGNTWTQGRAGVTDSTTTCSVTTR